MTLFEYFLLISAMWSHSGGASVLTAKRPCSYEVYNDIDGEVVNFLLVLREAPEKLTHACITLPYSRQLYEEWKWGDKPTDKFERAVRWFYLNRSGIAAGNNHRSGWRHSNATNSARDLRNACARLQDFAERMMNVQAECRDFREVIRVFDGPDTVFYCDPPYVGRENRYKGRFTEQDHRDLAELLKGIKGKAVVSYYESPLVDELYGGWYQEQIVTYKFSRPQDAGMERPKARELLFMNFGAIQQTLSVW
jgi:DNA adenine methylase